MSHIEECINNINKSLDEHIKNHPNIRLDVIKEITATSLIFNGFMKLYDEYFDTYIKSHYYEQFKNSESLQNFNSKIQTIFRQDIIKYHPYYSFTEDEIQMFILLFKKEYYPPFVDFCKLIKNINFRVIDKNQYLTTDLKYINSIKRNVIKIEK